jgi:2-methylcitrate dehydratase PrpD
MPDIPISEKLVAFSLNTTRTLPSSAVEIISLSLFDWMAVGLAGLQEPVSQKLRQYAQDTGGNPQASLFGTAGKTNSRTAALVNGTTSHALDYDDTHFAYIGHPSTVVFPTLLALAEAENLSMDGFLQAAVIGFETACRIGIWLGRGHYQIGYHQTATAGAVGATLAAARLLGLDHTETSHALGLISSRAAGLKSQFGTMGKPMNAGLAAANAVETVLLAQAGVTSNPNALSGQNGFAETHHGEQNAKTALAGLGSTYLLETVSHKYHACCHGLHASLEALRKARFDLDQLKHVNIRTHPRWMTVCNIAEPETALETKFSYSHTAALLLCGYDTGRLDTYTDALAQNSQLQALRKRITITPDAMVDEMASEICVTLADGTSLRHSHDLAEPANSTDIGKRLLVKATALLGPEKADDIWQSTQAQSGAIMAISRLMRGQ